MILNLGSHDNFLFTFKQYSFLDYEIIEAQPVFELISLSPLYKFRLKIS